MRYISIPIAITATLFLLAGCAGVGPLPTGSGAPEVTINSNDTKRIKELLVAYYASTGHTVAQDTQYSDGQQAA